MIRRTRPRDAGGGQQSSPPAGSARTTALRLLGRRDYSTAELTARLIDRGYDPTEVDTLISALRTERFLDDERVAKAHVRTASAIKGRGRHRIRRELEARGIAPSVVDDATTQVSANDEAETLRRLVERKTRGRTLDLAGRQRLFQQLLRRGFDATAIRKAIQGLKQVQA